jgi:preprotein translocase subunit YajC
MNPIFQAFHGQTADGGGGSALGMFVPMILIFVVFYFVFFRPQAKQQKKHQSFLQAMKKGDDVVTNGGIVGRIFQVDDRTVTLDVGAGTKLRVLKTQIASMWSEQGAIEAAKVEGKK